MEAYVLLGSLDYEGDKVLSVHSTEQGAIDAQQSYKDAVPISRQKFAAYSAEYWSTHENSKAFDFASVILGDFDSYSIEKFTIDSLPFVAR